MGLELKKLEATKNRRRISDQVVEYAERVRLTNINLKKVKYESIEAYRDLIRPECGRHCSRGGRSGARVASVDGESLDGDRIASGGQVDRRCAERRVVDRHVDRVQDANRVRIAAGQHTEFDHVGGRREGRA